MPIRATVKTLTFHNPDNGYSVLRLTEAGSGRLVTAVGNFPKLSPGESVELDGEWTRHEAFGEQFKVATWRLIPPDSLEAMERYLGGGVLKGVGPGTARRLVERFGLETFEVLDRFPERLAEVPKLRAKARETLLSGWRDSKAMREVLYFLQAHNLTANMAARIYKQYGSGAVETLRTNPYRLADEVWGIGFLKADEIALRLGFARDSYERIRSGLAYALGRSAEEGHVFLAREDLLKRAEALLQGGGEKAVFTLDNLAADDQVKREAAEGGDRYYLPWLWHAERGIARRIAQLCVHPVPIRASLAEDAIRAAESAFSNGFAYSDQQRSGIRDAVKKGIFLLTGGPGTGKTTMVLGLLEVLKRAGLKVRLAAPTGRAAKRLAEVTGQEASTLHRLLKYDPVEKRFTHDEVSPLPCDALVVDEVSMIDSVLMYAMLKAIKAGTRLILIGDPDQLPSVGPGQVLGELIRSEAVPHLHLDAIFRQAGGSLIVANAHRIHHGEMPVFPAALAAARSAEAAASEPGSTGVDGNFHLIPCREAEAGIESVARLVCEILPDRFGFHPLADVQVLSPMNQGPLGTVALNLALQARLNPRSEGVAHRDRQIKVRDKVMQLRNNYDRNVFNGDIGYVQSVSVEDRSVTVDFDGVKATYAGEELDQLALAYAVSVHKSQGSEFRAVVLILGRVHWVMLQRNLFYTGITRAREQLFLVAQNEAVRRAVENNPAVLRNTRLAEALREELADYAF